MKEGTERGGELQGTIEKVPQLPALSSLESSSRNIHQRPTSLLFRRLIEVCLFIYSCLSLFTTESSRVLPRAMLLKKEGREGGRGEGRVHCLCLCREGFKHARRMVPEQRACLGWGWGSGLTCLRAAQTTSPGKRHQPGGRGPVSPQWMALTAPLEE